MKKIIFPGINGNLKISFDYMGPNCELRSCVSIKGDIEGLRSLANLLLKLAEVDQEEMVFLPAGEAIYVDLNPSSQLNPDSEVTRIGRLDGKKTGAFPLGVKNLPIKGRPIVLTNEKLK